METATGQNAATASLREFSRAAKWVCSATPKRSILENLKAVRVTAADGRADISASDTEVSVSASTELLGDAAFVAFANADRLDAVLPEDAYGDVSVSADDGRLSLMYSGIEVDFKATDSDGWEDAPEERDGPVVSFTVPHGQFATAVRRTLFATYVESTRYALGGIAIDLDDGYPALVATDSRRLSITPLAAEIEGRNHATNVLPKKAMNLVARMECEAGEVLTVRLGETFAVFECGRFRVVTRYVLGKFPKWRSVTPKEFTAHIEVPAGPACRAFRMASKFTSEENRGVSVTTADHTMRVESLSGYHGRVCAVATVAGDDLAWPLLLDPRYITDFLSLVDEGVTVPFRVTKAGEPVLLTAGEWRYVVMPLSIYDE